MCESTETPGVPAEYRPFDFLMTQATGGVAKNGLIHCFHSVSVKRNVGVGVGEFRLVLLVMYL